jgi:2-polyprenyl-3-methyl-5-hydroxy-6-metoxy-1,4-benzoquinol methylase
MEKIKCIFCNHANAQQVIYENDYHGKQCNDCNLIYISPRPTVEDVIDLYGHDQAQISADTHIKGSYLKRLYAKHTLTLIQKYIQKGSLLEIGSGGGYFLDEARNSGFEPYGIELNTAQASFIKNNLGIACEQKPLDHTSFGHKKFDVIYHCDVISHFHDPIKEFRSMYSKLNPHGYVIFETGNIGDINKEYYSLFSAFQYPDHLFFFTQDNLKNLLEQTGFKICKIYTYSIIPQLKALSWFHKILGKKKSVNFSNKTVKVKQQDISTSILKKIYYQAIYFLRYKLGAFMPKKNRPQTLIVIAQKN